MTKVEREARKLYRVVAKPSHQVQRLHFGEWVVAYYCSSPEKASLCMERQIKKYIEWSKLSFDQKVKAILR
jgi:hypothetical protein